VVVKEENSAMLSAAGVLILVSAASLVPEETRAARIRVGESMTVALTKDDPLLPGHGPAKRYEFVAGSDGPVTISLQSYDFDAFLCVEDEEGTLVAEDDDGGIETNARAVFAARAEATYGVRVAAASEGAGEFTLSVSAGEIANPTGAALLEAGIAFRATAAKRALARGDKQGAAEHRLQEGSRRYDRSDFALAKAAYETALELVREIGDRRGEARALGNLGVVYGSLGDYAKARDYHERHLELARALGDRAGEARALGNLGVVYGSLGDYAKARDYHERHLELARALGDRAGEAAALGNLGVVYYSLGDYAAARELASTSLTLLDELGNEEALLYPLGTLARVALAGGEAAAAFDAVSRAIRILDRPATRSLGPTEGAGLRSRFADWATVTQDLIALRVERAEADRKARTQALADGFREAGRWKGRSLLEGIVEHRSGGRSAEVIHQRRRVSEVLAKRNAVLERVSRAIREGKSSDYVEGQREYAGALLSKAEQLRDSLRSIAPKEASLEVPVGVEPEAARRALLSKGTALLEYVEGQDRLFAYVLTAADLAFLELGRRESINELVTAYLGRVSGQGELGSPAEISKTGQALFETLLAPALRQTGEEVTRLVIVPTASLARLPFEALVIRSRGEAAPTSFAEVEFVLDRFDVCYGPSTPVLVDLAREEPRRGGERVLVLADPLYPGETAALGQASPAAPLTGFAWANRRARPQTGEWPRLEKTREEALALSRLLLGESPPPESAASLVRLSQARSAAQAAPSADVYLGAEASRQALAGDLRRYSVVHVAAHGYVDAEFPQQTALVLAGEGEAIYFTIGDVLDLDLDANLAVLSACETARGKPQAGEGIQSLARAFLFAGSRSVVASLWNVSDLAGAETMKGFYEQALRGVSVGESLRRAKLELRRLKGTRGVGGIVGGNPDAELAHPFFWAPFIYVGLPR
jgi:CHAT domain-containing protein/Tfp pilus assembly protein PilF